MRADANPWQQRVAGDLRGLAAPETAQGISVVFSATPGQLVTDSPKDLFAAQLLQAMQTPGLGFDAVVNQTRAAVLRLSGNTQSVWQSAPLPGDLVVLPAAAPAAPRPADPVEVGFWDTIKDSSAAADYQAYLSAYPQGQFAQIARARLAQLQPAATNNAPGETATPSPAPGAQAQAQAGAAEQPTAGRECPVCPEMVLVPPGKLAMGSTDGLPFETPVHEVTISKPFYIGRREVTFAEWDACLAEGGCQFRPSDRGLGRGLNPVVNLDWNDAKVYLAWLSRKTGGTYRLPTEAEWEYAARAGTTSAYYWGDAVEKDHANCVGCTANPVGKIMPTGSFPPNAFGLLDMAGNAAEWVEDCWADNYKNAPNDGSAYTKPDCRERVLRGGAFNNDQRFARTAARFKYDFDVRYSTNGFRVVRER